MEKTPQVAVVNVSVLERLAAALEESLEEIRAARQELELRLALIEEEGSAAC